MAGTAALVQKYQNIKFVIFDLDGTLVDSRRDIASAIGVALSAVGGPRVSREQIYPLIGLPLVEMFKRLLPTSRADRVEEAAEAYRNHYFDHCADQSELYDGVMVCLEGLRPRPLAIATTKMTFMAVRLVEQLGMDKYFQCVQGSDGIPHKPDPTILKMVMEKLGLRPEQGMMVGDTLMDILAGKNAGLKTCAVTYGIGEQADLQASRPDLLLHSLADLPRILSE